jgi:4,5-DOPA dioxygenase extradiol
MNAIGSNAWTQAWSAIGKSLPRPRAILCVSAHWYVAGTAVTAARHPRTIHDFGGFPQQLFEVQYPAPGGPDLAAQVGKLLAPVPVAQDLSWGLDHGTWSVLVHVFPEADIPVVQLSINEAKPASWHYAIARELAPLRDEGILILGSGNLVHNLHTYAWGSRDVEPFDWALRFEHLARTAMSEGEFSTLVNYEGLGRDATLAVPTPDHYLPLLYVLAQRQGDEPVTFPVAGFDGGSISMLAVQLG